MQQKIQRLWNMVSNMSFKKERRKLTTFPDDPSPNEVYLIGKIVETNDTIEELTEEIHELQDRIQNISQYVAEKEGLV